MKRSVPTPSISAALVQAEKWWLREHAPNLGDKPPKELRRPEDGGTRERATLSGEIW